MYNIRLYVPNVGDWQLTVREFLVSCGFPPSVRIFKSEITFSVYKLVFTVTLHLFVWVFSYSFHQILVSPVVTEELLHSDLNLGPPPLYYSGVNNRYWSGTPYLKYTEYSILRGSLVWFVGEGKGWKRIRQILWHHILPFIERVHDTPVRNGTGEDDREGLVTGAVRCDGSVVTVDQVGSPSDLLPSIPLWCLQRRRKEGRGASLTSIIEVVTDKRRNQGRGYLELSGRSHQRQG